MIEGSNFRGDVDHDADRLSNRGSKQNKALSCLGKGSLRSLIALVCCMGIILFLLSKLLLVLLVLSPDNSHTDASLMLRQ